MIPLNNQIGILIKGEMENMEVKPRRRDIVIILENLYSLGEKE